MLNLLIISNNIKAENIRKKLQPMLKAKIDILGDFDLGLKEVFEKRPTTVLIQEHLDGVSAENVARHIQMLLGNNGPTFVLMHDGNSTAKPVKGLFDHVLDLSMPAKPFFIELISKLKLIYGDQWEKFYISAESKVNEADIVADPIISSEAADRMADELLSDLHSENESVEEKVVSQPADIALIEVTETQIKEVSQNNAAPQSGLVSAIKKTASLNTSQNDDRSVVERKKPQINDNGVELSQPDRSKISDDILLSFEKNYRTDSNHWKSVAVTGGIVACILAGGWYLLGNNLSMVDVKKKNNEVPSAAVTQSVNPAAAINPQKQLSSATKSVNKTQATLPSFVPLNGRDFSFTGSGPGWERYLSESSDIRLFRSDGRIRAIQVLAVKGGTLSDVYLKNVLKEVVGSYQLKQLSVNQKQGFKMQRYSLEPKGELLLYRNKASEAISAFVLSLD